MPKLPKEQQAFLAPLIAESEKLAELIATATAKKSSIDAVISSYGGVSEKPYKTVKTAPPKKGRRPKVKSKALAGVATGVFYGKALPEACTVQLKIAGRAQTTKEIWEALSLAGYKITASNTNHAVHWSLRRRESVVGDVMLIGKGKWDLCERYSEEERNNIRKGLGAMDGRDYESHIDKTKRGIENSKANGVKWGAPVRVTDEVKAKLVRLLLDEKRSVAEACADVGIAGATYYNRPLNGESAHDFVKRAKAERKASPKTEKASSPDLLTPVAGNA
jgi:transposase-like protein